MFLEESIHIKGVSDKIIDSLTEIRKSCKTLHHVPAR